LAQNQCICRQLVVRLPPKPPVRRYPAALLRLKNMHFFVKKMEIGLDGMLAVWYKNK
jgi:hypothetical protein